VLAARKQAGKDLENEKNEFYIYKFRKLLERAKNSADPKNRDKVTVKSSIVKNSPIAADDIVQYLGKVWDKV